MMNKENLNSKSNKFLLDLVAHRGNIGSNIDGFNQVDNSMEAIQALVSALTFAPDLEDAIRGFECDVRLTKDNELVVIHEGNIKTITPEKHDIDIKNLTYHELHKIFINDINWYYHGLMARAFLFPHPRRLREIISQKLDKKVLVPKASDMFDYLSAVGYKGEILVELKEMTDECRDATIELINFYKNNLNIAVQSYDVNKVITIGEKTGVKTGILEDIWKMNQKSTIDKNFIENMPFEFYSLVWPKINQESLESLVENDKQLYTWTIDSTTHLLMVLKALENFYDKNGVLPKSTSLITNIPLLLNEYLTSDIKYKNPTIKAVIKKYNKLYGENYLIDDSNLTR